MFTLILRYASPKAVALRSGSFGGRGAGATPGVRLVCADRAAFPNGTVPGTS